MIQVDPFGDVLRMLFVTGSFFLASAGIAVLVIAVAEAINMIRRK